MFNVNSYDPEKQEQSSFFNTYKACFGQQTNEAYLKWKYRDNPAGILIAFEATHQNDLAGFYGLIPEQYIVAGKKIIVYQSVDTMTHPAYQKKGLFTLLAEKTYSALDEQKQETFLIGIPGSNSLHGFTNKLGWSCIHHISYSFIQKTIFKLLHSASKKTEFFTREILSFDTAEIADFLSGIQTPGPKIKQLVDVPFLEWRIMQNPTKKYSSISVHNKNELAGIVIYSMDKKNKCFIEWIGAQEHNYKQVLHVFCKFIFKSSKASFIYTWQPVQKNTKRMMASLGFLVNPFNSGPFSYKVPFIIRTTKSEINAVNLSNIHNYELQPILQD